MKTYTQAEVDEIVGALKELMANNILAMEDDKEALRAKLAQAEARVKELEDKLSWFRSKPSIYNLYKMRDSDGQ